MHDLRGNYNKPRTTSHGLSSFSYVSAKLRNALPDFIRTPLSLLVLKENRGSHFVPRLFFFINTSLNIVYLKYQVSNMFDFILTVSRGEFLSTISSHMSGSGRANRLARQFAQLFPHHV